ncbi:MAG: hypothetical protein J6V68_01440 [Clostridia bacterium]|nr:hypothetical protein [Clostridia bacterium]
MKKVLKIFVATLIAVISVFSFVACDVPETDFAEAKARLESKGYYVSYLTDADISDPTKKESLTATKGSDSLRMVKFDTYKMARLYLKQLELSLEYELEGLELQLDIAEFKVDEYEDVLSQAEKDELREEIAELELDIEELEDTQDFIGRKGKVVWYGTELAIKDSRG